MEKKAYMRTMEVFIAVFITFIFAIYYIPKLSASDVNVPTEQILNNLELNSDFRKCVINSNNSCVDSIIRGSLQKRYNFTFIITNDEEEQISNLPIKRVHSNSLFIGSNSTMYNPKIVRLYYWVR